HSAARITTEMSSCVQLWAMWRSVWFMGRTLVTRARSRLLGNPTVDQLMWPGLLCWYRQTPFGGNPRNHRRWLRYSLTIEKLTVGMSARNSHAEAWVIMSAMSSCAAFGNMVT